MINRNKNYCEIHHLYFKGDVCPFCIAERHERMSKHYFQKKEKEDNSDKTSDENFEVTEDIISKLQKHFNK